MKEEYLEKLAPPWGRIAGAVLLAFAGGLSVLVAVILIAIVRSLADPSMPSTVAVVLTCAIFGSCAFCWQAGLRLVLNRPSSSGSLFESPGWMAVGVMFAAGTLLIVVMVLETGRWLDVRYAIGAATLSTWCFYLAYRARDQRESLFPPQDRREGLLPPQD